MILWLLWLLLQSLLLLLLCLKFVAASLSCFVVVVAKCTYTQSRSRHRLLRSCLWGEKVASRSEVYTSLSMAISLLLEIRAMEAVCSHGISVSILPPKTTTTTGGMERAEAGGIR